MKSLQEVFDTNAKHLLAQGAKALRCSGNCAYRAQDGKRCAVGCLIPDRQYEPRMEGRVVSSRIVQSALSLAGVIPQEWFPGDVRYIEMLGALQHTHDFHPPEDWIDGLRRIATRYGLRWDVTL